MKAKQKRDEYPYPYPEFPLTANPNGQWSKKIFGKVYYFGVWADSQAAYELYEKQRDYLYAGLAPPSEAKTLSNVVDAFTAEKQQALREGAINDRTFKEYKAVGDTIIATLGKGRPAKSIGKPDLLRLRETLAKGKKGKTVSVVTHKRLLTFARMLFKYANDEFDANIKYAQPLASPKKPQLRKHRAKIGERLFAAEQIRALLAKADPHLKAIIYLGINCGFGPADCINLPADKIVDGFHNYARPKTGVERRCPLWKETQKAIKAIANGDHVLNGRVWNRHVIARQFKTLCESCGVYKEGVTTPYTLRRTFETVAKNSPVNQSVIDRIMGHERPDMSEVYNQRVFDQQLTACTDFVRNWLLGKVKLS